MKILYEYNLQDTPCFKIWIDKFKIKDENNLVVCRNVAKLHVTISKSCALFVYGLS